MEDQTVGEMTVRGKKYPVAFSIYTSGDVPTGRFHVEIDGKRLSNTDLNALYVEAMKETKRQSVKIAIPVARFIMPSHYTEAKVLRYEEGVITGKHAGNGNLIVKWGDRKDPEQMTGRYEMERVYRRMQPEQAAEYLRLQAAQDAADNEMEAFERRFKIADIDDEVDTEIEKKASEETRA